MWARAVPQRESLADEGLHRGLSRWNALAIVIGAVIGTGIYIRPASIAQLAGTPTAIMLVWIAAALLSLLGALTYAELANSIPKSGGEYAYLRETLGELPAFLFGWMRLTVGIGTVAGLAVAVSVFLADLFPLGEDWWRPAFQWSNHSVALGFGPKQLLAVLIIAGLAFINILGVGRAGRFQSWVTATKIIGLAALIISVAVFGGSPTNAAPADDPVPGTGSILAYGGALLAAMTAFNGWSNVAMLGGEVQEPRRNLPWALILGICVVATLYIGANLAFLQVLPMSAILGANSAAHPDASSIASRAAVAALGQRAGMALPVLFVISALGTLHCNLLAVPRVFFAMGRDGLFPAALGRIARTTRTPAVAISTLAASSAVLAALGSYDRLTNMAVFGNLAFFALNAFGLLRWRKREACNGAFIRNPITRSVPLLFLTVVTALIITLIIRGTLEIFAAIALMGFGWPVFLLMRWRRAVVGTCRRD